MNELPKHALRGRLNGVILQLEVARIALARDDKAMLALAIETAREEAHKAATEVERLDAQR